jgi:hypothetical protein
MAGHSDKDPGAQKRQHEKASENTCEPEEDAIDQRFSAVLSRSWRRYAG